MKKYKKVIEYETVCWDKEPIKYNELVIMGILFMIPIIGQITFLIALIQAIRSRDVYFQEFRK